MAYLTKDDLASHLYGENIDAITRQNDALVTEAIDAAVAEAKSYLSKYDLTKLFADAPIPDDVNLKRKVKDIACWNLLVLANANANLELFKMAKDDAIKWLVNIQKGQADPEGWPYPDDDPDTAVNEGGTISWSSNTQRRNQF
jgi:hypothetical protein